MCDEKSGSEHSLPTAGEDKENDAECGRECEEGKEPQYLEPGAHATEWDPAAYLSHFYTSMREDTAMETILFFWPLLAARLSPHVREAGATLLELGCGPTVHSAVALRNVVSRIYMAEYSPAARKMLIDFCDDSPHSFDWTNIVRCVQLYEAAGAQPAHMAAATRARIDAVLNCDVLDPRGALHTAFDGDYVLCKHGAQVPGQFDVVSTIFCLEYATADSAGYRTALGNACRLVRPGGYLAMGAILNDTHYTSGGKKFRCHTLTEAELFGILEEEAFELEGSPEYKYVNYDDIIVLLCRKSAV